MAETLATGIHQVYVLGVESLNKNHAEGLNTGNEAYVTTLAIVPPPDSAALESDLARVRSKLTSSSHPFAAAALGERTVTPPSTKGEGEPQQVTGTVVETTDRVTGHQGYSVSSYEPDVEANAARARQAWVSANQRARWQRAQTVAGHLADALNRFADPEGAGKRYREFMGRIAVGRPEPQPE